MLAGIRTKLKLKAARRISLPLYRVLIPRKIVGLYYHLVSAHPPAHVRHLYEHKTPEMFESDLAYLQRSYHPVSYEQFLESARRGKRLPDNALLLTFDDGFSECFSVVRPLLKKYGFPCIFFIPTDPIDNRSMLYRHKVSLCIERLKAGGADWKRSAFGALQAAMGIPIDGETSFVEWIKSLDYRQKEKVDRACEILEVDVEGYLETHKPYLSTGQIQALASDGFTIGAHTRTHPLLRLLSEEEVREQIVASCRVVQEITGSVQPPFSFPFSAHGLDRATLAGIRSTHFEVGYLFDTLGLQEDTSFIVNRIEADRPGGANGGSNLPGLIHHAYQQAFLSR